MQVSAEELAQINADIAAEMGYDDFEELQNELGEIGVDSESDSEIDVDVSSESENEAVVDTDDADIFAQVNTFTQAIKD